MGKGEVVLGLGIFGAVAVGAYLILSGKIKLPSIGDIIPPLKGVFEPIPKTDLPPPEVTPPRQRFFYEPVYTFLTEPVIERPINIFGVTIPVLAEIASTISPIIPPISTMIEQNGNGIKPIGYSIINEQIVKTSEVKLPIFETFASRYKKTLSRTRKRFAR